MSRRPFVLLTDSQPRSLNAKKSGAYVAYITSAATARMKARAKLVGKLYARIVWFHRGRSVADADNIAKRHLDGMRGVVFVDYVAVCKCLTHRINLNESYVLDGSQLEDDDLRALLGMLGDMERKNVVFTQIGEWGSAEVRLGSVEE